MGVSVSEVMPIFIIRLVAERGGTSRGGLLQVGSVGITVARRDLTPMEEEERASV